MYVASFLEKRFGLNAGYFKRAKKQKTKIFAEMIEDQGTLFIKTDPQVTELISQGYISTKLNQDDNLKLFDHILKLTKSTQIGFYK